MVITFMNRLQQVLQLWQSNTILLQFITLQAAIRFAKMIKVTGIYHLTQAKVWRKIVLAEAILFHPCFYQFKQAFCQIHDMQLNIELENWEYQFMNSGL